MSTLQYWNETKMAELGGTQAMHDMLLIISNIHRWHSESCSYGYCDIMLFTDGEGPHL